MFCVNVTIAKQGAAFVVTQATQERARSAVFWWVPVSCTATQGVGSQQDAAVQTGECGAVKADGFPGASSWGVEVWIGGAVQYGHSSRDVGVGVCVCVDRFICVCMGKVFN